MRAPEQLGPYRYEQSDTCFPLGQDSLALAAFATLRRGDRVCDLGCGGGALLLLLAGRQSTLALSGVEISPEDSALARKNLAENGLAGEIYTGDVRRVCKTLPAGGFSLVISNPPYFKAGSGGDGGAARMEETTLTQWCAAAGRLVKNGGRFALVHRPERLAELFAALQGCGLEPKRLQLIQHDTDMPPSAVLVEAVRQGRPGLEVLPTRLMNRR
ncbi:MAG: methyltransferase [Clostridiales bacterium]|uniref:tRNA1(Val) (adenine(37)-N6)-methyltransferase n=1 Tax=Flavonifractor porci TaxID=3133422 RepID=UPI0030AA7E6B|nr:methyltransferase [Clostridiales bacterium]